MTDAAEPVLVVDTGNSHDYGQPGDLVRLRTPFDGLAALPHAVGELTVGPEAELHGHTWKLFICPGGDEEEYKDHLSVYLELREPRPEAGVKADVTLRVINHAGEADQVHTLRAGCIWGKHDPPRSGPARGFSRFIRRADVLNATKGWLNGGAITIEADIRVYSKTPPLWSPPSRVTSDFLRLFESGESSDVTFIVGEERVRAHRLILLAQSPVLSSLCADADADIEISEVSPAVFKEVLRFTYCDELSSPDVLSTADAARAVLKAADRFGVTRLKQLAEIELATRHLSVESAADLLLLADAHSCPQLKESATELFVAKAPEVMATAGWARLSKSADLLAELMGEAFSPNKRPRDDDGEGADRVKRMRVSELRKELADADLDTDGARAHLEDRLREQLGRGRADGDSDGISDGESESD